MLCGWPYPYLYSLWCALDEHHNEPDVPEKGRRDEAAAMRFVRRMLRLNPVPRRNVIDPLRNYRMANHEAGGMKY